MYPSSFGRPASRSRRFVQMSDAYSATACVEFASAWSTVSRVAAQPGKSTRSSFDTRRSTRGGMLAVGGGGGTIPCVTGGTGGGMGTGSGAGATGFETPNFDPMAFVTVLVRSAKRGPFADLTNTVTNAIGSKFGVSKPVAPAPEPVTMAPPVPPVTTQGVIPLPPPPTANMPPRVERRMSKDEPADVPGWAATLDTVDQGDANSTQAVAEYAADICTNLRDVEAGLPKLDGYMDRQPDVNEKMRQILVDWLVEVHLKFKLSSETLFLTVRLLDRYLAAKTVKRSKLQLIGVTCMLLAAKFEEIYAPEVRDFVNITDKAYSKAEILDTEVCILNALQFRIQTVSPYFFLCRFLQVMKYGKTHTFLAQYILELTLVDYRMLKYPPTHLASSAALLAK